MGVFLFVCEVYRCVCEVGGLKEELRENDIKDGNCKYKWSG